MEFSPMGMPWQPGTGLTICTLAGSAVVNEPSGGNEQDLFDEVAYLRLHPDVAKAIAEGHATGAWQHYNEYGRSEGRQINDFDADYYLGAYPAVAEEIAAGDAATPFEHYRKFGRPRGFRSNPKAPRPANAAAMPSPYGGLWPDQANAADLLQGKLEIGQITERQAEQLRFWMQNGCVIIEKAIPPLLVDRAALDLARAYAGGFPDLQFECHAVSREPVPWQPEINPHPAKALDIHHFSAAIRNVMFADAVTEFLGLIFESKALASQTFGCLRGSAQEVRQDSAHVAYTIPRQFAASWIALEDITPGTGELFYYPGSHRFEDFLYNEHYKSVHEAQRLTGDAAMRGQVERHAQSLEERARQRGIAKSSFNARKGDVLIWHADLAHGGNPVSNPSTCKSIVTHYCPKHLSPLFSEHVATKLWNHGGHRYTSRYYSGEPLA
jgi:Phytanoyl-CoA dioxygenase (PhyH)